MGLGSKAEVAVEVENGQQRTESDKFFLNFIISRRTLVIVGVSTVDTRFVWLISHAFSRPRVKMRARIVV